MSTAISFRVLKKDKELIDKKIIDYAKDRGLLKGDAFIRIMKDYFSTEHFIDDADSVSVEHVLHVIDCPYLKIVNDELFACFELVHKQKIPKPLGVISEALGVIELCRSCQDRKVELHNIKIQNELKKVNIKKLAEFLKHYTQITKDGTEVISHLCLGDTSASALIFSYDGMYLSCPLLKQIDKETGIEFKEAVNIENICKKKINPETRETPCEYLALIPHLIKMRDIMDEDIESIIDPWADNIEQPLLEQPNEKQETIEAEFKVKDNDNGDDEEEENIEGNN
ncbi:hypothetical protein ES702_01459 [subsurface metagenome]